MARGNKLAELIKMVEKMQTRPDKSRKEIELMANTLQTLIKNTPNEKGDKRRSGGGENDKNKEEKGEKSTPQMNP